MRTLNLDRTGLVTSAEIQLKSDFIGNMFYMQYHASKELHKHE